MFRPLFLITGLFAIALGALLIVAPGVYVDLYLDAQEPSRTFAAQRLAPAIVGLGGLFLVLRELEHGPMVMRVSLISAAVWGGVAATGVFHYVTGTAQPTILVAAAIEVVLACLFLIVARQAQQA